MNGVIHSYRAASRACEELIGTGARHLSELGPVLMQVGRCWDPRFGRD
jgi:hypothetical protein